MVVVLLLLFTTGVFARMISFGLGSTLAFPQDSEVELGGELRVGFYFLEATAVSFFKSETTTTLYTGGVAFELLDLIRVGAGMGALTQLNYSEGFKAWRYMDEEFHYVTADSLDEAFLKGMFHYRVYLETAVSDFTIGLTYQVPTSGLTLTDFDLQKLAPLWHQGKFGISTLYWLF